MTARHGRCIADTSRNLTAFIDAASVAFSASYGCRTECQIPQSSSNLALLASNLYCFGHSFAGLLTSHICLMNVYVSACSMANYLKPNDTQRKRYKDKLRVNLKPAIYDYTKLEALVADRSQWRRVCYSAVEQFEQRRIDTDKTRRPSTKARTFTNSSTSTSYICDTCRLQMMQF